MVKQKLSTKVLLFASLMVLPQMVLAEKYAWPNVVSLNGAVCRPTSGDNLSRIEYWGQGWVEIKQDNTEILCPLTERNVDPGIYKSFANHPDTGERIKYISNPERLELERRVSMRIRGDMVCHVYWADAWSNQVKRSSIRQTFSALPINHIFWVNPFEPEVEPDGFKFWPLSVSYGVKCVGQAGSVIERIQLVVSDNLDRDVAFYD